MEKDTDTVFAAKILEAGEENRDLAAAEYRTVRSLRHERIAALYDAFKYGSVCDSHGWDCCAIFADCDDRGERPTTGTREPGRGGGQWGQLAPTTWKLWGHRPLNFGLLMSLFLFLFVFARELGALPKNSGSHPRSF